VRSLSLSALACCSTTVLDSDDRHDTCVRCRVPSFFLLPAACCLLLVEWESLEDHAEGFRGSAASQDCRATLHRFL
jgi:hypothetical protein